MGGFGSKAKYGVENASSSRAGPRRRRRGFWAARRPRDLIVFPLVLGLVGGAPAQGWGLRYIVTVLGLIGGAPEGETPRAIEFALLVSYIRYDYRLFCGGGSELLISAYKL